ncbi:DUF2634 domain-containing protein [Clostridium sp. HMP27]|uniref:DUF2634 domain-containing protein n=1 Tax=Clostridium sp. HMP27 TaxID=1487921 RepID=UPI000B13A1E3|nr:DUF2634 domain-containing protein [Clostridium sp. HMP27]
MSLFPRVDIPNFNNVHKYATKTYALDINSGEINGKVDGLEAIKQLCIKTIYTSRFRHIVYSFNYGSEIEDLIGLDLTEEFLKSELVRMITEALEYDDRINKVHSFDIKTKMDNIYIKFTVDTVEGELTISEVIKRV